MICFSNGALSMVSYTPGPSVAQSTTPSPAAYASSIAAGPVRPMSLVRPIWNMCEPSLDVATKHVSTPASVLIFTHVKALKTGGLRTLVLGKARFGFSGALNATGGCPHTTPHPVS
eukprot:6317492-Prymnesium_polylepis.1